MSSFICDFWGIADGLKYYDLEEGKGPVAEKGSKVQVFCNEWTPLFYFPTVSDQILLIQHDLYYFISLLPS